MIFLTALTATADKLRAFDAGGVDYVTKPFQFEEVLARVTAHVALRRAQTALADSYEGLRALERLRDNLVHMIVHDMRSPLTALQIDLNLLKGPAAALDEVSRQGLQAALDSVKALNRMANDLLDVSRLEEGKMPIDRAEWDLTQIASEVRSALRSIDRERPIDIETAGPVRADNATVPLSAACWRILSATGSGTLPPAAGFAYPSRAIAAACASRFTTRGAVCHQKPERRSSTSSAPCRLDTTGAITLSGWVSPSASSPSDAQGGTIGVDSGVPAGSTFWFELPA